MYIEHFRLKSLPFENVPDPKFFFNQGNHSKVHRQVSDSLKAGRGLMVVTGPMGSGKTTLSQKIIAELTNDVKLIWIAMPPETATDLFMFLALELGLKPESKETTFILRDIRERLTELHTKGLKCLVIIDESHLISDDTINGLRLLNNLEAGSVKLIQILLLGQEELMEIINKPENEHFKQRIAALGTLNMMDPRSIHKYILHRLHIAGGRPAILSQTGLKALILSFGTGSTPRTINSLCDRAFNICFQKRKRMLDVDDVYDAAGEMGLQKNVYFYKIELRQKQKQLERELDKELQKENQPPPKPTVEPLQESAVKPAPPENQTSKESDGIHDSTVSIEPPRATGRRKTITIAEPERISAKPENNSISWPVYLLITSLVTFSFSIIFHSMRCQAPDKLVCLLDLFSF